MKFFINRLISTDGLYLVVIALLTALASEIKVVPFNDEAFRFGLGSITFFLLILIRTPRYLVRTGLVTGVIVVCFRLFGDILLDDVSLLMSLKYHLPVFLYYFLFACGFHFVKVEKYKMMPLLLGAFAAGFETIGNGAEYATRHWLLSHSQLSLKEWMLLMGVALLRSYFVVGLYSSITIAEQQKRMQEMLEVGSELYGETVYLQKSMDHIEQVTAKSFELYSALKREELKQLSEQALLIAQEIHEVKKDSQRILSGLMKVTEKRNARLFLGDILNLVIRSNEKYSEWLKKHISFHLKMSVDFETDKQIPLLAVLNNVIANSVEAIPSKGSVELTVFEHEGYTHFLIKDSGKGILEEELAIIFEPGYTTKYNDHGVAATGIGLSHVREIVNALEGNIQVEGQEEWTVFELKIPTINIRKRVE